jgi:hypothetical protein
MKRGKGDEVLDQGTGLDENCEDVQYVGFR